MTRSLVATLSFTVLLLFILNGVDGRVNVNKNKFRESLRVIHADELGGDTPSHEDAFFDDITLAARSVGNEVFDMPNVNYDARLPSASLKAILDQPTPTSNLEIFTFSGSGFSGDVCDCNDHSDTCDFNTGICSGCTGNTQGDHCEVCTNGYIVS
jgi:hypothetical protein